MAAFGFLTAAPDLDGVFRNYQLVQETEGTLLPSVGMKGFIDFYADGKEKQVQIGYRSGRGFTLKLLDQSGEQEIPLNEQGELKVRFFGGRNNFHDVPIWKVYEDKHPERNDELKQIFGGRAVIIGSSATAAYDLRHTPVDSVMPGMYMHANAFHDLDQPGQYDDEIDRKTAAEVRRRMAAFRLVPAFEHERRAKWQFTQESLQANPARNAAIVSLAQVSRAAG